MTQREAKAYVTSDYFVQFLFPRFAILVHAHSVTLKQCGNRGELNSDFTGSGFVVREGIEGGKKPPSFAHKVNYLGKRWYEHYKCERCNYSSLLFSITRKERGKKSKSARDSSKTDRSSAEGMVPLTLATVPTGHGICVYFGIIV